LEKNKKELMNKYQIYQQVDIQQNFIDSNKKGNNNKNKNSNKDMKDESKENCSESTDDLDFSASLMIKDEETDYIYINSLSNNNIENGNFYTIQTIESNLETQNKNILPNKNKKAKKDLDNSHNSLTISSSLDEDDLKNEFLDCNQIHLQEMIRLSQKKERKKRQPKPIKYIDPNSDRVKKVELFILPKKVNDALNKNKSTPIFCPINEAKYDEFLKKVSYKEFKVLGKEGPKIPKTWTEKLRAFPSATTYISYAKNRYRDVLANEISRVRLKGSFKFFLFHFTKIKNNIKSKYIKCIKIIATMIKKKKFRLFFL
jgi:hypothetical protein